MKKWINKQTTIAFILGILIAIGVPAAAATRAIKEAEFNTATSITINGQAVPLELIAVTLEGDVNASNYAPVRALAEALGGTVDYDNKTKAITIKTNEKATVLKTKTTTRSSIDIGPEPEENLKDFPIEYID